MFNRVLRSITLLLVLVLVWSGWPGTGKVSAAEQDNQQLVVEWSKQYSEEELPGYLQHFSLTSDGGYIVASYIEEYINHYKVYVAKLSTSGDVEWEQEFRYQDGMNCYPTDVFETRDGNYLVVGVPMPEFTPQSWDSKVYLTKLSDEGNVLWNKGYEFEGNYVDIGAAVEAEDGGYVVTGAVGNRDYATFDDKVAYLFKTDQDGNKLWDQQIRQERLQTFYDVTSTSDGGAIAVGRTEKSSEFDALVVKFGKNGEIVWTTQFQETDLLTSTASSVIPATDGNGYLIKGDLDRKQCESCNQRNREEYYVAKVSINGEILWVQENLPLDGDFFVIPNELMSTSFGNLLNGVNYKPTYLKPVFLKMNESTGEFVGRILPVSGDPRSEFSMRLNIAPTSDRGLIALGVAKEGGTRKQLTKYRIDDGPEERTLTRIDFAEGPDIKILAGESRTSVVRAVYSDKSTKVIAPSDVRFTSADSSITTVDENGKITGIGEGVTEITASYAGLDTVLRVEVRAEDSGNPGGQGPFFLDSEEYSLTVGDQFELEARFRDEQGQVYLVNEDTVFTIADSSIATIDELGNVKGVSPGFTYVTAEYQGLTYRAVLWIVRPYSPQS